jgi:diguanylate cyclase
MQAYNQSEVLMNPRPIGVRLKSIFSRSQTWTRGRKQFDQHAYDNVGAFMKKYALEPSPENYALVFNFIVRNDTTLLEEIGQLIKTGYTKNENRLPADTERFETDLAQLANSTQEQLAGIELIIARTRGEATEYGSALQDASGDIDVQKQIDNEALLSLCELTRVMISKTRAVESELRSRGKAIEGLIGSLQDARSKADTDALTGLSNRRAFERQLGATFERAKQSGNVSTLAICDIDRFKLINDNFGHQTGDRVIQFVADSLAYNCGDRGHVFRFGGEEYVILFENVGCSEARECIERAMQDLAARNFVHSKTNKPIGAVTFSCGLSETGSFKDPGSLLGSADRALYEAKASGRNCIKEGSADDTN